MFQKPDLTNPQVKTVEGPDARLQVFMAMKIQVVVSWILTPSSDTVGYQHFGEPSCYHLHPSRWKQVQLLKM
jgi:hypothetical protein